MTDLTLSQLVAQARIEHPCSHGHDWQSEGGRSCPNDPDCGGSQTVYRCARCGDHDYGEPGGPGHADCLNFCRHDGDLEKT